MKSSAPFFGLNCLSKSKLLKVFGFSKTSFCKIGSNKVENHFEN